MYLARVYISLEMVGSLSFVLKYGQKDNGQLLFQVSWLFSNVTSLNWDFERK